MTFIIFIIFYLVGVVLAYGRINADPIMRDIRAICIISWPILFGAVINKERDEKWLQFRSPAKLQAKHELAQKRFQARQAKRIEVEPRDYSDKKIEAYLWMK